MCWDPLTIKFAVALAVKCITKGFEVVRKWLPWPSWRIGQRYRQADMDVTPIDMNNCRLKTLSSSHSAKNCGPCQTTRIELSEVFRIL